MVAKLVFFAVIICTLSLSYSFGQTIPARDYNLYTSVIQHELSSTAKSAVIITELLNEQDSRIIAKAIWEKDVNTLARLSHELQFNPVSIDSLSLQAFEAYFSHDTSTVKFEKGFTTSVPISLLSKSRFNSLFKKNPNHGWKHFYKLFPNAEGVFEFSRISYSPQFNRAVVYRAVRRNGLNGNGHLLLFGKTTDNKWSIIHCFSLWDN